MVLGPFWMGLVADKRINGSLVFMKTLAVLILSIAGGIFLPGKSTFFFLYFWGIAYFAFLMSFHISMDYELKMKHIFVCLDNHEEDTCHKYCFYLKDLYLYHHSIITHWHYFKVPAFSLLAGWFSHNYDYSKSFSTVIISPFIPSN